MCGLLLAINTKQPKTKTKSVNEWILNQYEDQCNRGQKGFGIIFIDKKGKTTIKRATEPLKFLLDLNLYESNKIIAHHRAPTSTDNKISQTHPISIKNEILSHDYLVIHNGMIHNDEELKTSHEKLGFKYTTEEMDTRYSKGNELVFNDSEAAAIEAVLFVEKKKEIIAAKGSMALIILQINKKTQKSEKVFFFRNGNPLNMSKTKGKLRLSSEGEGDPIEQDVMYNCEINGDMKLLKRTITYETIADKIITKEVVKTIFPQGRRVYRNSMGSYSDYSVEDITQQKRMEEIEDALATEAKDTEKVDIDDKIYEYQEREVENINDVLNEFNLDLDVNPDNADVDNTTTLIKEILERLKDTIKKSKELFERTTAQKEPSIKITKNLPIKV